LFKKTEGILGVKTHASDSNYQIIGWQMPKFSSYYCKVTSPYHHHNKHSAQFQLFQILQTFCSDTKLKNLGKNDDKSIKL
jgi:hypothetical protein